jgi:hypothetical protein
MHTFCTTIIYPVITDMVLLLALGTGVYATENDTMVRIVHASPDARHIMLSWTEKLLLKDRNDRKVLSRDNC